MRITLVTHFFPAHSGGVERVAGELASRLARAGAVRIDWHASDCDPPPPETSGLRCTPARSWNAVERRLGFPYPVWSPEALQRLVRAVRGAEVVHLHDCHYLPNLVAFAAARWARRPVLVTQHVGFVPYRSALMRALLSVAHRLVGAWLLGGATQVVFESETVRRYFSGFVRFRSAPLLVPNGVDTAQFAPAPAGRRVELRAGLGVPQDGRPLLLFVGRFVEKKGLPLLEQLTLRIPGAHWVFAGWGALDPSAWRRPNVTVLHRPSSGQLSALYQAADLFVLPSTGEGFPLAIQEAMACGTPALVGEDTAIGCVAADEATLLREKLGLDDDAERWAARLAALLASPDKLQSLRPGVAAFAREHWSWHRCAARYAELLSTVSRQQRA